MRNYRSTTAWQWVEQGWVGQVQYTTSTPGIAILKVRVMPSMKVSSAEPRDCWVALNRHDGWVIASHCTCMGGLGETCYHCASLLFKIEAIHSSRSKGVCTDQLCK